MDLAEALAIYKLSNLSSEEDVQHRYKELIRKYHPDRNHKHSDWCHKRIREISEALDLIIENLPLDSQFGWECQYQVMSDEPPQGEEAVSQTIHQSSHKNKLRYSHDIIQGTMATYYQYGLENKQIRREGPRRFRFRSVQRTLHNLEQEIAQWLSDPALESQHPFFKVHYYYVQHTRSYILDPMPKQDLDGPPYIRRAFITVRDALIACEEIIKVFFLGEGYLNDGEIARLHNSLQLVVVLSQTYKHGRWFDQTHRFILWVESFLALANDWERL